MSAESATGESCGRSDACIDCRFFEGFPSTLWNLCARGARNPSSRPRPETPINTSVPDVLADTSLLKDTNRARARLAAERARIELPGAPRAQATVAARDLGSRHGCVMVCHGVSRTRQPAAAARQRVRRRCVETDHASRRPRLCRHAARILGSGAESGVRAYRRRGGKSAAASRAERAVADVSPARGSARGAWTQSAALSAAMRPASDLNPARRMRSNRRSAALTGCLGRGDGGGGGSSAVRAVAARLTTSSAAASRICRQVPRRPGRCR